MSSLPSESSDVNSHDALTGEDRRDDHSDDSASNAAPDVAKHPSLFVVGIGASAGGIPALKKLFAALPADSGMAFIVVLHLSPEHESHLADILQSETAMRVTQVRETIAMEQNNVYVNSPAIHLKVNDGFITTVEPEPTRGRRVPIDLMFRTLGEAYRDRSICVILSGTGADGTLGLKRIKESGGLAIVQDPNEAEYNAMVRSAIETNLVDLVLPIAEMPSKLLALRARGESLSGSTGSDNMPRISSEADALREVLTLLRIRTGHDFSGYKRATLMRRIERRLNVNDVGSILDYLSFLRSNPDEIASLLRDLLISVTNFFRDTAAFEDLESKVIPRLFDGKGIGDVVRVWTAACATGEEAYSVAILLYEYASTLDEPPRIQVFASDIDADAIATARAGRYNDTITLDVSPERLQQFFVQDGADYRVKKILREMVLFAQHNILRDPPFSQLDLATCRNLLIYLNREAQQRVFEMLHFALRRGGYLMLGTSESAEAVPQLYTSVEAKRHLYRTRAAELGHRPAPVIESNGFGLASNSPIRESRVTAAPSFGAIHHTLVERYAPPSLLVDADFDILHISESGGRYLRFAGGDMATNVLKVVDPALRSHLRDMLIEARQSRRDASVRRTVRRHGEDLTVRITVRPCEPVGDATGLFLVMFEENKELPDTLVDEPSLDPLVESHVQRLENELDVANERLRMRGEMNEVSDQELRSSNEELQSIIEELRSASEELETSKEELQSVNEELSTVNHELKNKIDEVSIANGDLQNLLASTKIATIFLDGAMHIRRYTPLTSGLFNIIDSDVGRPISHLTHKLEYDQLEADAREVHRTQTSLEREILATDGRTFITRLIPYRTLEGGIEGVVITFIDITDRTAAEESRRWLSAIVSSSNDAIISFTLDGTIVSWNDSAERLFGYTCDEIVGQSVSMLSGDEHKGELDELVARIRRGEAINNYETERTRKSGEPVAVSMSVSSITDLDGRVRGVTAIVQDITDRHHVERELEHLARRKDEFLAMLAHELRNPLAPILSGLDVIREARGNATAIDFAVGIIARQTTQLVRLVDDLLDVSRISNGAISLQIRRVDIRSVLSLATETMRGQLEAAQQEFIVEFPDEPVYVDVDAARVTQVIVNLLGNAAKYSRSGGTVTLSAAVVGDFVSMSVRDSGIGIDPEMLTSIFEIFTQIESGRLHQRGGLGIGLNVVRTLVEMHGGTVEARSDGEDRGSEFIVRLPLSRSQSPETVDDVQLALPDAHDDINPPTALRVLVVDDNVDAAYMLNELLRFQRHTVRSLHTGIEGVEEAARFQPDVCILDIGLPDIDGFEVARRIRANDPDVFLVALTGWGTADDRTRSHDAGFDHHLVKPVELAVLKRLLATRQSRPVRS